MIKHLMLLSIVSIATLSSAKDTDSCFDLKKYVPPAFNYHLLQLNPRFSIDGENGKGRDIYYIDQENTDLRENESRRSNVQPAGGLQARYKYYGWKGRTEWQIGTEITSDGRVSHREPYWNRDSYYQTYSTDYNNSGSVTGKTTVAAAHYFKWPFFIGGTITPSASGSMYHNNSVTKSAENSIENGIIDIGSRRYTYRDHKTYYKNYSAGITVNCRLGAGHIDDVSFAVAALNIFDKIAETESSFDRCSTKHVQELAALVEKMRKRKVFDSRIGRIENIDTLCKYLKNSGIVDGLTPRTVLEIADQWDYVFYQTRRKGFTIELHPTVKYSRSSYYQYICSVQSDKYGLPRSYNLTLDNNNEFDGDSTSTEEIDYYNRSKRSEYSAVLSTQYEIPLNRYFQFGVNGTIAPSIVHTWINDKTWSIKLPAEANGTFPMLSATETVRLGYFPNTRTSFTISESINYERISDYISLHGSGYKVYDESTKGDFDRRKLEMSLQLDATYYVSPRLLLHFNAGIRWLDLYQKSFGQLPWLYEKASFDSNKAFSYQLGGNLVWGIL